MTVLEIIQLIQSLVVRHPEIEAFYTGLESQHDDDVLQYPAFRLVYPYELNQDTKTGAMTFKIKATVMVNKARQGINPSVNVNYSTENSLLTENNDLYLENDMRDNAARLATHIVEFLKLSEKEYKFFSVTSANIRSLERSGSNLTTGCAIFFEFAIGNPYICEAQEIFKLTAV